LHFNDKAQGASVQTFIEPPLISEMTSRILLNTGAVLFNAQKPFVFTSGWASPVYVDCRRVISYPIPRQVLTRFAAGEIQRRIGMGNIDSVVGGEAAGIPFAAWIADVLGLPMQFVRKKTQGFGGKAQVEGVLTEGMRTLLVEDLTTDGRSKLDFCQALRRAGAKVDHIFVLFYYDIFEQSRRIIADLGVTMHALATWRDVLAVAKTSGHFDSKTLGEVESFLDSPAEWSARHGGLSEFPDSLQ
jgi:orotate phosphoribosyltransferase